jgi:hypothetical protein
MVRTRLDINRSVPRRSEAPLPSSPKCARRCDDPIIAFLEARIAEKECNVRRFYGTRASKLAPVEGEPGPLGRLILAECTLKRAILANWRAAAEAESITRIGDAVDTVALSRRSMLRILAAGHEAHPGYREEWFDRA